MMKFFEIETNSEKLKRKCDIVTESELNSLFPIFEEMKHFLIENRGWGLAAPQIKIQKSFFITRDDNDQFEIFINPSIVRRSLQKFSMIEGCFSCPDIFIPICRSKTIRVNYVNQNWVSKSSTFSNVKSAVIQHEFDHLQGRLISDFLLSNRLNLK